ncbi:MAG: 50S ribosomal protein L11 methyltransferase [Clostridiales bacterium]|nr:50S ribosomal protein L11 methyltransferase [Clostridiales bacterium]
MEWIELIVHTTTEGTDSVSGLLMDCGAAGTMIEDRSDIPDPNQPHGIWEIIDPALLDSMPEDVLVHAWFEESPSLPSLLDSIRSRLSELSAGSSAGLDYGSLQLDTRSVNDQAWTDVWKKYFKPFHAGTHLVIKPTWEPFSPAPDDLVIEIDPGMAFGSGTHETTGMCLSLLEEVIAGGEEIIDVGTGSGILAIGAALLGAGRVLAVDIDPDAVKVAQENVKHNRVEQIVSVQQGNLLDRVSDTCDICVANIISNVIISFAAPLMSHIRPGGLFICSGIVSQRSDEVAEALNAAGYRILRKVTRGEWTAFLSGRN